MPKTGTAPTRLGRRRFLTGVPAAVAAVGPLVSGAASGSSRIGDAPQDAASARASSRVAEVGRADHRSALHGRRGGDGPARRGRKPRKLRGAAPTRHPARHRTGDHVPSVSAGHASTTAGHAKRRAADLPGAEGSPCTSRLEDLAFEPVTVLSALIRRRRVTSTDLTKMYLARLEQLRRAAALRRDAHRRSRAGAGGEGRPRSEGRTVPRRRCTASPGAPKDLFATKGIRTTWGATPYANQVIDCGCDGGRTAARRRRRARRQALDGRARPGRRLVRRHDAKPVEPRDRLERLVGRTVRGNRRRAWSASRSAPKRAARSSRRPASAASSGCGRPTAASAATARWRSAGRWTRSARSAAAWKTARSCSTRSTAPTAATTPSWTRRSSGTPARR